MNKPIHDAAHYAEILRTRATLERSRKKTKPRHGLAANFDDAAAYLDMVMTQAKEITRLTDALEQYRTDLGARDKVARDRLKRIEQLEGVLRQIADYRSPPDKARNDLEICQDQSSVRGRLARNALGSAGDSAPCKHEWDYTGTEASCTKCHMLRSENPCKHLSVTTPDSGFYNCNGCGMSFSERPLPPLETNP